MPTERKRAPALGESCFIDSPNRNFALQVTNPQRSIPVNLRLFKRLLRAVLGELYENFQCELGVHLVSRSEITRLNETFLHHRGPTDVVAFDYKGARTPSSASSCEGSGSRLQGLADDGVCAPVLHGEIFICVDEALSQAHRFRTTWQSELTRYLIHGLLHLRGYDDQHPAARRRMKRQEDRLLRRISKQFDLGRLKAQ